ncbi:MAG: Excinuclease abc c subunit domain protein [Candidatus Moranbacteria bacterium GW2011_GWC1_45_18]|nr:MAG: Excinuclease abc c subunit domain protein [Candidatus Moranbacteria bacterium GW2011_GWC2_40_12]KKT33359.1 MAG: Excinuclease abc c subunit domain protein [Candidatus Moranbacteria bacterium GW2011_GWF2_44_10]KKT72462.1 MAG: Excinuclease abc c subunit domain protein [Candidatus Moranbacteria bacterium GW2011_GWF1_44_4]KKT99942.1 MAG: Excinuclease abc c subunit domain protein [Candidatus Moranbacteria bacterium GW2011_GWC1_45_18]OGI24466.1 MAG: hypothetical protein A2194_01370 [Candidatus
MFEVYILESLPKPSKYYIGHTKDLKNRLNKHNRGLVKSTKNARPWKVIYSEIFNTKNIAYRRELKIKSYKGGEAFKRLIKTGASHSGNCSRL